MTSIFDREAGTRWKRGQRFQLSPLGFDAEAQYQSMVVNSRVEGGRDALDRAAVSWAAERGVLPRDAVYLSELKATPKTLPEILEALSDCGATKTEAKAAIDRLVGSKLAEPVVS